MLGRVEINMSLFKRVFKKRGSDPLPAQGNARSATENNDGLSLLDAHKNGSIDDKSFLRSFGEIKVFYSTPFGDHKDGGSRLFALPAQDKTGYLPIFTSMERAMEFYETAGRCGYLLMEGTFISFLETTRDINAGDTPVKLGAVIDPGYYGVTVHANALAAVIGMTK